VRESATPSTRAEQISRWSLNRHESSSRRIFSHTQGEVQASGIHIAYWHVSSALRSKINVILLFRSKCREWILYLHAWVWMFSSPSVVLWDSDKKMREKNFLSTMVSMNLEK
jgi:hypothetical protein